VRRIIQIPIMQHSAMAKDAHGNLEPYMGAIAKDHDVVSLLIPIAAPRSLKPLAPLITSTLL
jgi:hypothetical protein